MVYVGVDWNPIQLLNNLIWKIMIFDDCKGMRYAPDDDDDFDQQAYDDAMNDRFDAMREMD